MQLNRRSGAAPGDRLARGRRGRARRTAQAGVGLVEILVAVLVLGFGLLGVAAMQSLALRNSQSAMERSQAVVQAYAMIDAMRANADQARQGAYNMSAARCATPAGGSPSSPDGASLANADQQAWIQSLGASLGRRPTTCGRVSCDAAGLCLVTVQWDDSRGGAGGEANGERKTYTLQARL